MKRTVLAAWIVLSIAPAVAQNRYHGAFVESFDDPELTNFTYSHYGHNTEADYRYTTGAPSLSEKGTSVMIYRIDPDDPAGAGKGPEIISKHYTHYGTYSARLRIPAAARVQPNVGAVVGYFTYNMEREAGLSEIDWEWLIADPQLIYIGTWTGTGDCLQRVGRTINLATGEILNTLYRSPRDGNVNHPLTGEQCLPDTIPAIGNYDASARFYTYGFDWLPDRLTWWILHPLTQERIVLWDYRGSTPDFSGIPTNRTRYRLNFWHTNNWPVDTNPHSIEPPRYPYEVEIDWMDYQPLKEQGNKPRTRQRRWP